MMLLQLLVRRAQSSRVNSKRGLGGSMPDGVGKKSQLVASEIAGLVSYAVNCADTCMILD